MCVPGADEGPRRKLKVFRVHGGYLSSHSGPGLKLQTEPLREPGQAEPGQAELSRAEPGCTHIESVFFVVWRGRGQMWRGGTMCGGGGASVAVNIHSNIRTHVT